MSCFVLGNTFNTASPTIVNMANPKKYTALFEIRIKYSKFE